jgi:hypothetical protein
MKPALTPGVRTLGLLLTIAIGPFCAACGSSPPAQAPSPPASTTSNEGAAPAPQPPSTPAATPPTAADYKDPTESNGAIRLTPLFTVGAAASLFPKATMSDIGCLAQVKITGKHEKDFPAVVAACGAPTGLAEYAKPVTGMLHSMLDTHDSYVVALAPGYCYRVLAVGDQSIFDLGLSVQPVAGGPATEDGARGSVAMIDNDKPLCVDKAGDYAITLAIDGMGYGGYTLGVWARPKN